MSATATDPLAGLRLAIVDGRPEATLSVQDGIGDLTVVPAPDGYLIRLGAGTQLDAPLVVEYVSTGHPAICSRLRLEVGPDSRLTLIERHLGDGLDRAVAATELVLGAGADVRHISLALGETGRHHARLVADVGAEASYALQAFTLGGLERACELTVTLDGPGAEVAVDGLDVALGEERAVMRAAIHHASPRTRSRQRHRVLAGDRAKCEFHGRIQVERGAALTDAAQASRALLLGDGATVEARPELAIFADDVKCAHGTAIGQLDEAAMFYLMSRGLDAQAAREALIVAFAAEVLDEIAQPALREAVTGTLKRRLAAEEER